MKAIVLKESERPPTPEAVPTIDALTYEQRSAAFACATTKRLRDVIKDGKLEEPKRGMKILISLKILLDGDGSIPQDLYDTWTLNRNRNAKRAAFQRVERVRPSVQEKADWILANMKTTKGCMRQRSRTTGI